MAQAKEVRGPGPRMGGPRPKVENPGKLLKRIMDEVFRHYLPPCILVLVCIVVSALANVQASLFLKTLMDDLSLIHIYLEWNIGYQPYTFNYHGVQQTFRGAVSYTHLDVYKRQK